MNHKVIVMKASDEDDDDNIHFTNLTGNHSDTHVILQRSIYHKYGWRARDVQFLLMFLETITWNTLTQFRSQ